MEETSLTTMGRTTAIGRERILEKKRGKKSKDFDEDFWGYDAAREKKRVSGGEIIARRSRTVARHKRETFDKILSCTILRAKMALICTEK